MHRQERKRAKKKRSHLSAQQTFPFRRREGHRVGRPRKKGSGVWHVKREALGSRYPVHVVMRIEKGLPSLRTKHPFKVLRGAFRAGCEREGFRLNHFSVQSTHLHFIVEAKDRTTLARGLQGLSIRIARGLNKLWGRKGSVFADRYFDRILRTPREVRNALQYVLKNSTHHKAYDGDRPDIFSSGMFFDGWREWSLDEFTVSEEGMVSPARTWLQREGWRKHGLIPFFKAS